MSGGVTKDQLMRYIEVEKQVKQLESNPQVKEYGTMKKNIDDIDGTIQKVTSDLAELVKKTKKEKDDVDELLKNKVKLLSLGDKSFDKAMSKEEAEYLEALNLEEVCRQQLEGLKKQKADLQNQESTQKKDIDKLNKLYEQRDQLLSDIFGGEYGSELENMLEAEFDTAMDKRKRIDVAHYKWKNGRILLQHAVKQLQTAVAKWQELPSIPTSEKYQPATECRNFLIASIQNIQSTQRYLDTIDFPYCKPKEVETLQKATNNVHSDMMDPSRHKHALQCYDVTFRRASALLQWFDSVIEGTISKDLQKESEKVRTAEQKLRAERIRLIREKIKESGGDASELDDAGLADQQQIKDEDTPFITKPNQVDEHDLPEREMPPPTPLPLNQLAPMPDKNDLFGDAEEIKEKHKKEQEDFARAQEMNKARMDQGLQEKLAARRRKRRV